MGKVTSPRFAPNLGCELLQPATPYPLPYQCSLGAGIQGLKHLTFGERALLEYDQGRIIIANVNFYKK